MEGGKDFKEAGKEAGKEADKEAGKGAGPSQSSRKGTQQPLASTGFSRGLRDSTMGSSRDSTTVD